MASFLNFFSNEASVVNIIVIVLKRPADVKIVSPNKATKLIYKSVFLLSSISKFFTAGTEIKLTDRKWLSTLSLRTTEQKLVLSKKQCFFDNCAKLIAVSIRLKKCYASTTNLSLNFSTGNVF